MDVIKRKVTLQNDNTSFIHTRGKTTWGWNNWSGQRQGCRLGKRLGVKHKVGKLDRNDLDFARLSCE